MLKKLLKVINILTVNSVNLKKCKSFFYCSAVKLFCGTSVYAYHRAKLGANQVGVKEQFEKRLEIIKSGASAGQ